MTHEQIDKIWFQALKETTAAGDRFVRYHFCDLITNEKIASLEVENAALKADNEHWKSLVFLLTKARE